MYCFLLKDFNLFVRDIREDIKKVEVSSKLSLKSHQEIKNTIPKYHRQCNK